MARGNTTGTFKTARLFALASVMEMPIFSLSAGEGISTLQPSPLYMSAILGSAGSLSHSLCLRQVEILGQFAELDAKVVEVEIDHTDPSEQLGLCLLRNGVALSRRLRKSIKQTSKELRRDARELGSEFSLAQLCDSRCKVVQTHQGGEVVGHAPDISMIARIKARRTRQIS